MSAQPEQPKWKFPSHQQEISNRSILRIQQLSNDLAERLNRLPLFQTSGVPAGKIEKVLFAARDPGRSAAGRTESPKECWYNFRLCASYDFPKDVVDWMAGESPTSACDRLGQFEALFKIAQLDPETRARFKGFCENFKANKNRPDATRDRKDYDQLIIALALLPYRGFLLELFERAFKDKQAPNCCYFWGTDTCFSIRKFDEFGWECSNNTPTENPLVDSASQGNLNLPHDLAEYEEALNRLCKNFILPFTRGEESFKLTNESPYLSAEPPELNGFVVPAYDIYDPAEMAWQGGFAGWLVVFFRPSHSLWEAHFTEGSKVSNTAKYKDRQHSWLFFTQLLQQYVFHVREAHMLDLLEEYAESPTPEAPISYFEKHIHHLTGWKKSQNDDSGAELKITFDDAQMTLKTKVEPLWDTKWPADPLDAENLGEFRRGARRLCKTFLEDLRLIYSERQKGRSEEKQYQFFATSHELKDLTSLIPKADGKQFMLRLLKDAFLDFSLPATGLSEKKHRGDISPQLYGNRENLDGTVGARCSNLSDWIIELIDLAAGVQALAISAKKTTPKSDDQLRAWKTDIASHFELDPSLVTQPVPQVWEIACLYGVTILCALRNIIKHSFDFDKSADLSAFEWKYRWNSHRITRSVS